MPEKNENFKFIGLEHIESHASKILGHGKSSETKSLKNKFNKGDILYGKLRPYLNKICVQNLMEYVLLIFWYSKKLPIINLYLQYYLQQICTICVSKYVRSSTSPSGSEKLSDYIIPFPSLSEQNKIGEEIEMKFSMMENTGKIIQNK